MSQCPKHPDYDYDDCDPCERAAIQDARRSGSLVSRPAVPPEETPEERGQRWAREVFDAVRKEAGLAPRDRRAERRAELERQGFPFATEADMAAIDTTPQAPVAPPPTPEDQDAIDAALRAYHGWKPHERNVEYHRQSMRAAIAAYRATAPQASVPHPPTPEDQGSCPKCGAIEATPHHPWCQAAHPPTPEGIEREALAKIVVRSVMEGRAVGLDGTDQACALHTADAILAEGFRRTAGQSAHTPTPEGFGSWTACAQRQPPNEPTPPSDDDPWPTVYLTYPHFAQLSYFDDAWRRFDHDAESWRLVRGVTHWMPLPAAPAVLP